MVTKEITNDEINELPLKHFEGKIQVIDNQKELEKIIPELQIQECIGFDTETKPSFKKGKINQVSLLQLSTHEKAYLIRLNKTGLPASLANILSNKKITKIGVAIKDDIRSLQRLCNFTPKGFVELQNFVKDYNIESNGLKKISAIVLNIKISKSQQLSNWEQDLLTKKQEEYAATDAWVCLEIYQRLINYKK